MLVHLAALARAARRGDVATPEEHQLLTELQSLLGLVLVDAGTLTVDAVRLAPAAAMTLTTANTFFNLAERLSGSRPATDAPPEGTPEVDPPAPGDLRIVPPS